MAYQVLARKYRPKRFENVVGQPCIVQALSNALTQQSLHHAWLFTGTRGVGKTTLARIFAKCLNCETGVTATPCDQCNHCLEIDAGRFPDFYEVDAASRTKVEDTRDLLNDVQYVPVKGRYKVYLIDEVHMLSGHSFNALLKTLEEPPEHVKFLLATTEQQKLPVTVLSRCLQFHLQQTSIENIQNHLEKLLQQEGVEYDSIATRLIAKAARGSIRDALSLLDQCIAFGNRHVFAEDTKKILGIIEPATLFALLEALRDRDGEKLLEQINWLYQQGVDFSVALGDLLSILHQISVIQVVPNAGGKNADEYSNQIQSLATTISAEDTQLFYQIGIIGQRDLPHAPDPKTGFEMTLLRMLAFYPQQNLPLKIAYKPAKAATGTTTSKNNNQKPPQAQDNQWHNILPQLKLGGVALALAQNCSLKQIDETQIHLVLAKKHKPLMLASALKKINETLSSHFQRPITANIQISETTETTPSDIIQQDTLTKKQIAGQLIAKDSTIQRLVKTFDATLINDTIATKT